MVSNAQEKMSKGKRWSVVTQIGGYGVLDKGANAVAMRSDEDLLATLDCWCEGGVPTRKNTCNGVLETFCTWYQIIGEAGVLGFFAGEVLVIYRRWRWRHVITSAPDENLVDVREKETNPG